MAVLKSTPLTFMGMPRLPEDTVQSCTTSQVLLGRLLGILLGLILIDGARLKLGPVLGSFE
eukprot:scaffold115037_cov102-Attheya_sp.AAC.1